MEASVHPGRIVPFRSASIPTVAVLSLSLLLALAGAAVAQGAAGGGLSADQLDAARSHCETFAGANEHIRAPAGAFCGCLLDSLRSRLTPQQAAPLLRSMAGTPADSTGEWHFDRHLTDRGGISRAQADSLRGTFRSALGPALRACAAPRAADGAGGAGSSSGGSGTSAAGAASASGSSTTASGEDEAACSTKGCFADRFAACRAARFTSKTRMGRARYEVEGRSGDACRVSMEYLQNPNPSWTGKKVTLSLDPDRPLAGQLRQGVRACLTGRGGADLDCEGSLVGIAGGS